MLHTLISCRFCTRVNFVALVLVLTMILTVFGKSGTISKVFYDLTTLPAEATLHAIKSPSLASVPALLRPLGMNFAPPPTLPAARFSHSAALLANGMVLVVGGADDTHYFADAELYNPATNVWSVTGSLARARSYATLTVLRSGKVLIVGGYDNTSIAQAELYDPVAQTWSSAGSLLTGRHNHSATLLPDGKVLVAGGLNNVTGGPLTSLDTVEIYDPASNMWSVAGTMNGKRRRHTAILLPNGKVLVAGGREDSPISSADLASTEIYDPQSNTWTVTGSMNQARVFFSSTLLPNGKVLAVGGENNGAELATAELYDLGTQTWTPAANLTQARSYQTATLLPNGKVLLIGDAPPNASATILTSIELYDPATNSWQAAGNLQTGRYAHTTTLLPNGKVLAMGGLGNSDVVLGTAELYDPNAIGSWSATANLASARFAHSATLLPNGKVLSVGGADAGSYLASAELYDPATNGWNVAANLSRARQSHTVTLLANGKVLIAGGYDNTSIAQAELYDPVTDAWSSAGTMLTGRHNHSATLLPDGKVLVVGGLNNVSGEPLISLDSAEIYNPATNTWSAAGALNVKRRTHTATLLPNGKVLVAGGREDTLLNNTELASAEIYDPQTNAWAVTGSMNTARIFFSTTLLPNGKVLAVGGYGNGIGLATAEVYDPSTQSWTPAANMSQARNSHTATLTSDGKVMIAGGARGTLRPVLTGTELYDPVTNTWSAMSNLNVAGYGHTATLLANSKVLVIGGFGDGDVALSRAELYDAGLGYGNAWRPALSNVSPVLAPGTALTVQGTKFQGVSEASSGGYNSTATNYPLVQLRSLVNDQIAFLPVDAVAGWTDISFTSLPVNGFPTGYALVTVFANAIPGVAQVTKIGTPTVIATQPVNQAVCEKTPVTFSVTVTGLGVSYQWRRNGVNIVGAMSASFTQNNAQPSHAGSYDVVVAGACGTVVSAAATLTVNPAPSVTQHPANQTVPAGTIVTFSAAAASTTPMSIQWQVNTGGNNYTNIPGATSTTLNITANATTDGNRYRAAFANACGTDNSQAARLRLSK